MENYILKEKHGFDRVAGYDAVKSALAKALVKPQQGDKDDCTVGERILLHGPPGVGKTFIANAVSAEIGESVFLRLSSTELISKFLPAEKTVNELFDLALSQSCKVVIFLDDIDMLYWNEPTTKSSENVRKELIKRLDTTSDKIVVFSAAQCPWKLLPEMRARFSRNILLSLPDRETRVDIIKAGLDLNKVSLTEAEYDVLSEMTNSFVAADIMVGIRNAEMTPIRELQNAKYWKEIDDRFVPCPADESGCVEAGVFDLPAEKIFGRDIDVEDLKKSFQETRATVEKDMTDQHLNYGCR